MAWVAVPNEDGTKSLVHSDLCNDYLAHHGIKGQKWGVIRFRNKAGTKKHKRTSSKKSGKQIKHKRTSSKKSGKQIKTNSKITKIFKQYKDSGEDLWRLQQDLQRAQMQMMQEQMWMNQQQINNYNSIPTFL